MLLALFHLLSFFPLWFLHGLGTSLGWLVYLVSPTYRRRLKKNIHQAGYDACLNSAIAEAGKGFLELPFIWCASPQRVLATARIENWGVVQEVIDGGLGIIFLTPHLGCFEITAQAIAAKIPLMALYRPSRKKALQPLMEQARTRPNLSLAPANLSGVRSMLKTLKKGGAVGLLPDQVPQNGEGVWADFFGLPAYTMTLSSKLHVMTGAPIILTYAERLSFGRGFVIRFSSMNQSQAEFQDSTPQQQAQSINLAMEKLIASCPAQYLWSYNRYKTPAHVAAAPNVTSTTR